MNNILVFFLISLFMFSCKPDAIELNVPQAPGKIAVASQQVEGGFLVLTLSRTFSALSDKRATLSDSIRPLPEELLVKGAFVQLTRDGGQITLTEMSPGVYATEQLTPVDYANYTLQVTDAEKGHTLSSQTVMLPQVRFDTVGVVRNPQKETEYTIHYAFTDLPGMGNWYVVNYYTKDNRRDSLPRNPADVDYIAKRMLEQRLDYDLISESDIQGGQYSITKNFTNNKLDTFAVALSNISQGYYEFLKAQKKYNTLVNQIRGEVVNLPTNISNGYGYFNLHTPHVKAIDLSK
ncbi:MAG: DUF4249 family protein [Bacteroidota bacterium]